MSRRHLSIIFWRRAARQIEQANEWWRAHRAGRPEALTEELTRVLELISRQPGVEVPAEAQRLVGVRLRVAPRKEELQLLAFWHARRGSKPSL